MLLNQARARRILAEEGLDAVILSTPANVLYGSDCVTEFMLGRFEDFTAAVLLTADEATAPAFVVPEFDLPFLVESPTWIEDVRVYGNPWSSVGVFMGATLEAHLDTPLRGQLKDLRADTGPHQKETFVDAVVQVVRDRGLGSARLGCDDMRLAGILEGQGLGGNAGIADALQIMRRVRCVKTDPEIEILTRGAQINAGALAKVIEGGRRGIAESDMTRIYRRELTEHDARYLGERGMMFGAGDASAFSLPASAERTLAAGDAVVLDCLGTYRLYHMDLARTAVVGAATSEQRRCYDAARTALEEVEASIRPGVHTQDLRGLVRQSIKQSGLREEVVSVTTHGLGLDVFEFPYADSLKNGFVLEENMVVNTEVFYRDPDLGSFHLEDSVLVTGDGCRLLHEISRDLVEFT